MISKEFDKLRQQTNKKQMSWNHICLFFSSQAWTPVLQDIDVKMDNAGLIMVK